MTSFYKIIIMQKKLNLQAFSLVEMMVVIMIIAILWTIAFISYRSFNLSARDASRVSQIETIQKNIEMYRINKPLPTPENNVRVESSGTLLGYQWYLWQEWLNALDYNKWWWKDPMDDSFFTYYVTENFSKYQILVYFEKWYTSFIPQSYALTDYSKRIINVYGDKLWILTDTMNTPIQEINLIKTAWKLDIANTTTLYKAIFTDKGSITWTWSSLDAIVNPNKSCYTILKTGWWESSWVYTINPTGTWAFQVYCDMVTDGWGWTRYVSIKWNYSYQNALDCYNWIVVNNSNFECFSPVYANPKKLLLKTWWTTRIWTVTLWTETVDGSWITWNSNRSYFDGMTNGSSKIIRLGKDYKSFWRCYGWVYWWSYMNYDWNNNFWPTPWNREWNAKLWELYFR